MAELYFYDTAEPRKALFSFAALEGLAATPSKCNDSTVMGMLYMMTRMGTAKKVTSVFEDVVGKQPQSFRQFVKKNLAARER